MRFALAVFVLTLLQSVHIRPSSLENMESALPRLPMFPRRSENWYSRTGKTWK